MTQHLTKAEKLVLVGKKVMMTLAEAYASSRNRCHIDWVSLTFKKSILLNSDFFRAYQDVVPSYRKDVDDSDFVACEDFDAYIVRVLNRKFAHITGFHTGTMRPGRNYYKYTQTLINDQGEEVGCVSGGGHGQRDSFNLVLRGAGCTFARPQWQQHLHDFAVPLEGNLARVDIALDLFNGECGGVEEVRNAYLSGQFDYNGRRPISANLGSWDHGHSRSYSIGKRGSKSVCAYEKGHAYGIMDSKWWRFEQRFGSQDRILPLEILISPDKFFAGAYPYNAKLLDSVEPETIKTKTKVQDMTSEAVIQRKLKWFETTIAPSIVHLTNAFDEGQHGFMWLCDLAVKHAYREVPRSLRSIPLSVLKQAIQKLLTPTPPVPAGLVAT